MTIDPSDSNRQTQSERSRYGPSVIIKGEGSCGTPRCLNQVPFTPPTDRVLALEGNLRSVKMGRLVTVGGVKETYNLPPFFLQRKRNCRRRGKTQVLRTGVCDPVETTVRERIPENLTRSFHVKFLFTQVSRNQ